MSSITVYCDPDPGTTSKSSLCLRGPVAGGAGESWNSQTTGNGISASNAADNNIIAGYCGTTLNQYQYMGRGIFLFDTSALTAGANISAATISIAGSTFHGLGTTALPTVDIYTSSPASNTAQAAADYQTCGSTSQTGGATISYATWVANGTAYNNFALSATGIGNIAKTGISKFATREATYDVTNSAPPWVSGAGYEMDGQYSAATGTSVDPKIVITYTLGISPFNGRQPQAPIRASFY